MSIRLDGPFRLSPDATDVELVAKYFRGFGDPTRLRILALVADRERSVGELVEALDQPQPKISNHLACLRWCGFVTAERRGKRVFYRVAQLGRDRRDHPHPLAAGRQPRARRAVRPGPGRSRFLERGPASA